MVLNNIDPICAEYLPEAMKTLQTIDIIRNTASHIHRPAYVEDQNSIDSSTPPSTPPPEFSSSVRAFAFSDDR